MDLPDFPDLPDIPDITTPCPVLDQLTDEVTSAANRAVESITSSIPSDPTSGTATGIAAKIASAVSTVKAEAEQVIEDAKGLAAEIEETFMEYVTTAQNKIAELEAALEEATGELREWILQQIEETKAGIQEIIPAWLNKTPDELLNDAIAGVCDPEVYGLGKPAEGTAKKVIPSETPTVNPGSTEVEVFAVPDKPPVDSNPIVINPETGVTD